MRGFVLTAGEEPKFQANLSIISRDMIDSNIALLIAKFNKHTFNPEKIVWFDESQTFYDPRFPSVSFGYFA